MGKIKISLTVEEDVYVRFKDYCAKNGMKVSTRVELMMKETAKDSTLKQFIN
jgi:antitoxin component of RelBE/YafQ-DinJ toxin-antitoxin module